MKKGSKPKVISNVVSNKPFPSVISQRNPLDPKIGGIGNTMRNATKNYKKGKSS